ncbi:MAG: shikimate kinase [Spirochaetales bacterium]
MNIYFCGMIGSGKTTLGKRLAEELGLPYYDLDWEMDAILGYSFHRLVEEQGWVAFRELEYSICKDFARRKNSIIGLGGGTVRYEWNRDALRGSGIIILLEASIPELVRRVSLADRPRVNPGTSTEEDIRIIWEKYKDRYIGAADIIYRTDEKTLEEELQDLKEMVRTDPRFAGLKIPMAKDRRQYEQN